MSGRIESSETAVMTWPLALGFGSTVMQGRFGGGSREKQMRVQILESADVSIRPPLNESLIL